MNLLIKLFASIALAYFMIPFVWTCYEFDQLLPSSFADCFSGISSYSSQMKEFCLDGYNFLEEEFYEDHFDCFFKG